MRESSIVDHTGQPIKVADLKTELAEAQITGLRSPFNFGSVASYLNPAHLSSVLERANNHDHHDFLTMAEELEERDAQYGAVLGSRKRALTGLELNITAASDSAQDETIADECRTLIEQPEFGFLLTDALDGLGKGYSVSEIIWETSSRQWMPTDYRHRDPRFFNYDRVTGREILLITDDNYLGEKLAPFKFITHVPQVKSGLPIRGALGRLVAVAYMCKGIALADWMTFAEIFGMPIRVGKYGRNATPEEQATLRRAVANIGTDAAAIIPDGMSIDFVNAANGAGGPELYKGLCEYLDKQISKGVLGQTMTTDDGSSQSQANVHNDVRIDILKADAKQLEYTLNRDVIRPYIDLNYGRQKKYPWLSIPVPEPEDTTALVDAVEKLVPMGFRVAKKDISDKLGLRTPDDDEDVLEAPAQTPMPIESLGENPSALNHQTALNSENTPADEIELLLAELSDPQNWQAQLNPVLKPIITLVKGAQNEQEILDELPNLLDQMDSEELVQALALAQFKARGVGESEL